MDALVSPRMSETEREADGFIQGLAVGIVSDNKDDDGLARVRVKLPWHADGDTSFWARLAMPMAGNDRGIYFVPEVGDEVVVAFEHGNPTMCIVLGVVWSDTNPPPATNDDGNNNTRLIRSREGHEVRINDDANAPELEMKLNDGKHVRFDQNGIVIEDENSNTIEIASSSGAISVTANQALNLKAGSVTIEADASINIKSGGTLTLKGTAVQIN